MAPGLGDSCGCAMGAKFLGAALIASTGWYCWLVLQHRISLWSSCWRVLLVSFLAAAVGKIIGIGAYKMRSSAASRLQRSAQSSSNSVGQIHIQVNESSR